MSFFDKIKCFGEKEEYHILVDISTGGPQEKNPDYNQNAIRGSPHGAHLHKRSEAEVYIKEEPAPGNIFYLYDNPTVLMVNAPFMLCELQHTIRSIYEKDKSLQRIPVKK